MKLSARLRLLPARQWPCPALPGLKRQRDIIGDGKVADDAIRLALFGTEAEPGRNGGLGRRNRRRFSVNHRGAGIGTVDAEQQEGGLRSSGAKKTGNADDLSRPDAEIEGAMLPRLP